MSVRLHCERSVPGHLAANWEPLSGAATTGSDDGTPDRSGGSYRSVDPMVKRTAFSNGPKPPGAELSADSGTMRGVLLSELVRTSEAVAAAPGRGTKIDQIAALLRATEAGEIRVAVAFLSGDLTQRQIGVGYALLSELRRAQPAAVAHTSPLTLAETDATFEAVGAVFGPGSQAEKRRLVGALFSRAAPAERSFLSRLLSGELHQGALEGVMIEAVARAAGVSAEDVRRAHLLGGSLQAVAQAALGAPARAADGAPDPGAASAALRAFRLQVGRPLRPMLAAAAPSVSAAFERISPAAVEWKIDGVRVQVHKRGDEVRVFTRTLDDITARVPEVTEAVLATGASSMVLDGEVIALDADGTPRPFQVTASRAGSHPGARDQRQDVPLTPFFFDLLHLDGEDLVDEPASERHARMATVLPPELRVPRIVTRDVAEAEAFFADAIAQGHEGVVVKATDSPYAAGRRGSGWIKVKPRHTLDLVVLAAEWGHGRRRGWLSNLHLGARDPVTGGFVMLGKTFKGLTDELLTWQTGRLLELADPPGAGTGPDAQESFGVVHVRPELVVEIAFDGVQASRRYPGGLALRFARVLRYRPDKPVSEADTIESVRALWPVRPAEAG
ncbi:MAG TPA: ATP-dependent DNA ligase [Streptosporangiaceae bacterium]|nr:ATP-dependent DNA ligase [Streptosporangiaceae bacterium]